MKNKFLLVWSFLIAFSATAFAQNEPEKGEVPELPDVFEQLEEVVVTAGGIAREKKALGFGVDSSISITYIKVFATLMITYAASSVYRNVDTIELGFRFGFGSDRKHCDHRCKAPERSTCLIHVQKVVQESVQIVGDQAKKSESQQSF